MFGKSKKEKKADVNIPKGAPTQGAADPFSATGAFPGAMPGMDVNASMAAFPGMGMPDVSGMTQASTMPADMSSMQMPPADMAATQMMPSIGGFGMPTPDMGAQMGTAAPMMDPFASINPGVDMNAPQNNMIPQMGFGEASAFGMQPMTDPAFGTIGMPQTSQVATPAMRQEPSQPTPQPTAENQAMSVAETLEAAGIDASFFDPFWESPLKAASVPEPTRKTEAPTVTLTPADLVGAILGITDLIRQFDVSVASDSVMSYSEYLHRVADLHGMSGVTTPEDAARIAEEKRKLDHAMVYSDSDGTVLEDVLFTAQGPKAIPMVFDDIYVRPYISTAAGYPILKFDGSNILGENESFGYGVVSFSTLGDHYMR